MFGLHEVWLVKDDEGQFYTFEAKSIYHERKRKILLTDEELNYIKKIDKERIKVHMMLEEKWEK